MQLIKSLLSLLVIFTKAKFDRWIYELFLFFVFFCFSFFLSTSIRNLFGNEAEGNFKKLFSQYFSFCIRNEIWIWKWKWNMNLKMETDSIRMVNLFFTLYLFSLNCIFFHRERQKMALKWTSEDQINWPLNTPAIV